MILVMHVSIRLLIVIFLVSCVPTTPPTPTIELAILTPYTKPDPNGCPIETIAEFEYETPVQGDFTGTLRVSGLTPERWYAFTINGWPSRPGNNELKDSCQITSDGGQGYCDFPVQADDTGTINEEISRGLPDGEYAVKFLLKDPSTANSCVILFNDNPPRFEIVK